MRNKSGRLEDWKTVFLRYTINDTRYTVNRQPSTVNRQPSTWVNPNKIMLKNYLRIAWRNLLKNKVSSTINISGLAVGISVALLIGLWIWDEVSFDKDNNHYDRIAEVMQNQNLNGEIQTWQSLPYHFGECIAHQF